MSMTSKVNPGLRTTIITALTPTEADAATSTFPVMSNQRIYEMVMATVSLRKIQEATQKLTKDGVLVTAGRGFYALSDAYINNTLAQSAAV